MRNIVSHMTNKNSKKKYSNRTRSYSPIISNEPSGAYIDSLNALADETETRETTRVHDRRTERIQDRKSSQEILRQDKYRIKHAVRERCVSASARPNIGAEQTILAKKLLKPILTGIDKLKFSVPVSPLELDSAVRAASQLKHEYSNRFTYRSNKSEWFKHKFVLTFDSDTPLRPSKAVFLMEANLANAKTQMQVIVNPNHMTKGDTNLFIEVWRDLFGLDARVLASNVAIMRLDANADCPYYMGDLFIDQDRTRVGDKIIIKTNGGSEIQTCYMGSVQSAEHTIAYNQVASDTNKEEQAGAPPQYQGGADDALLLLDLTDQARTRIEIRRVFKQHSSVSGLGTMTDPFGLIKVYHLDSRKAKKLSVEFLCYLDCVRVRGVRGAGKYLLAKGGGTGARAAKEAVREYERQFAQLAAAWWKPQDYADNILMLLKVLPVWRFLRPVGKSHNRKR
jgi:hypothetical protein